MCYKYLKGRPCSCERAAFGSILKSESVLRNEVGDEGCG